jgi:hypothetical protein
MAAMGAKLQTPCDNGKGKGGNEETKSEDQPGFRAVVGFWASTLRPAMQDYGGRGDFRPALRDFGSRSSAFRFLLAGLAEIALFR